VVLTVDMQQVQFTPNVQSSSSFYLRKLSNYNTCICDANDETSSMLLWTEVEGSRGSNENASSIYKYVTEHYQRNGPAKQLTAWFDRCVGQNNNTIVLSMLMKLVRQGFFKQFTQKVFVTGHTFNDSDRKFGLIEKQNKSRTLQLPSEIETIIRDSCVNNPFVPIRMRQDIPIYPNHPYQYIPKWYLLDLLPGARRYPAFHRISQGQGVYQVSYRDQADEVRVRICNLCIFRTYCNKNV